MKTILTTLFLVCTATTALSQEHTLTLGNYPDCVRRGGNFCSISADRTQSGSTVNNISFVHLKNGSTVLRIYREKLTQQEHDIILGEPITNMNMHSLVFVLENRFVIPDAIIALTSKSNDKQVKTLEAKAYPTTITKKYIDITITQ